MFFPTADSILVKNAIHLPIAGGHRWNLREFLFDIFLPFLLYPPLFFFGETSSTVKTHHPRADKRPTGCYTSDTGRYNLDWCACVCVCVA